MCAFKIRVERVQTSRTAELDPNNLPFGTVFSDHMLVVEFRNGGWGEPTIRPYGPLQLPPKSNHTSLVQCQTESPGGTGLRPVHAARMAAPP
jgi:hypothetical protein